MISKEDLDVWNNYITNLYNKPESKFMPSKIIDDIPTYIDLHGLTIQTAFQKTNDFLVSHSTIGTKVVTIITGKSGKINDEFPYWCSNFPFIRECTPIKDSRGNFGSFMVYFKKPNRGK